MLRYICSITWKNGVVHSVWKQKDAVNEVNCALMIKRQESYSEELGRVSDQGRYMCV